VFSLLFILVNSGRLGLLQLILQKGQNLRHFCVMGEDVSTRVASCAGDSSPGKVRETGCVSRHSILLLLLQPVKWRMDSLFL
jgi:hypothetical protein